MLRNVSSPKARAASGIARRGNFMRLVWTVMVAAIGSLAASADAIASGFAVRENCTEGLGTAFAGAGPLPDNPCTVFNNPAGMTRLEGTQFELGATPVFPTINFHGTDT